MVVVLSSIRQGVAQKVSRFFNKRFDAQRATEEAAITYITKLGTLEDRILAIREMNIDETMAETVDEFINWSSQTWEAAIPYMTAKDDSYLLRKINAYLNNHAIFLRHKYRLEARKQEREVILEAIGVGIRVRSEIVNRIPNGTKSVEAEISILDPIEEETEEEEEYGLELGTEDITRIKMLEQILPTELAERLNLANVIQIEDAVRQERVDMLQDSKLMIAISFGKADVEASKTYVISKPEIMTRASRPPTMTTSADLDQLVGDLRFMTEQAQRLERLQS